VSDRIEKLVMPKWGMSMTQGTLVDWLAVEGAELAVGDEVAEVETEKINGVIEATVAGVLRRRVAVAGESVPVGGLVAVVAQASVSESEIDEFIDQFRSSFRPDEEANVAGAEPQSIEVLGKKVRFLQDGDAEEAVLLIHGFGGDLESWLFNQSALASGRSVYALDLPGHGGSSKDVGQGDLEALTSVVEGFLEARDQGPAHVVGHSLGGAIALTLALRRPDLVASLTLVSSASLGREINADFIEGMVRATSRRELKPYLELLFADPSLVTRTFVENVLRNKRLDGASEALSSIACQMLTDGAQATVLGSRLAEVSAPILVIWGDEDQIIPVRHSAGLGDRARVQILTGVGHSPHMEMAGEFNRLVDDFITQGE
jgi:pyruvate dehydrogenase E2 component (dihydrolipoamide acetyltransferase)